MTTRQAALCWRDAASELNLRASSRLLSSCAHFIMTCASKHGGRIDTTHHGMYTLLNRQAVRGQDKTASQQPRQSLTLSDVDLTVSNITDQIPNCN